MISLLMPTRARPHNLERISRSILDTAENPKDLELIIYIDNDDHSYDEYLKKPLIKPKVIRGERIVLSEMWNKCFEKAKGDILMHLGDDIIFQTKNWDLTVKETFDDYPDHIVFVYGNDGSPGGRDFGTHGIIHRKWAETVGYFVPPYFSSDYNDTALNYMAEKIGRKRYIDILTEHMHPDLHKGDFDITHQERKARHNRDDVGAIYHSKMPEFDEAAERLRRAIDEFQR